MPPVYAATPPPPLANTHQSNPLFCATHPATTGLTAPPRQWWASVTHTDVPRAVQVHFCDSGTPLPLMPQAQLNLLESLSVVEPGDGSAPCPLQDRPVPSPHSPVKAKAKRVDIRRCSHPGDEMGCSRRQR